MRNFKKVMAVLVTLAMLLSVTCITSFAADSAAIVLSGEAEATVDDTYVLTVALQDDGTIGGVNGTITYDTAVFGNPVVALDLEFVADNTEASGELVNTQTAGTIKFVGTTDLDAADSQTWFTVTFDVIAAGEAEFAVTATAADKTGVATTIAGSELAVTAVEAVTLPTDPSVTVEYAELKANASDPDLRFKVAFDATGAEQAGLSVKTFGVLVGVNRALEQDGVVLDVNAKENRPDIVTGTEFSPKYMTTDDEGLSVAYITLTNTYDSNNTDEASANNLMGTRYAVRAYIVLSDGTVLYSTNDNQFVEKGCAVKSLTGCAKLAAGQIAANLEEGEAKTKLGIYSSYGTLPYNTGDYNKLDLLSLIDANSEYFSQTN